MFSLTALDWRWYIDFGEQDFCGEVFGCQGVAVFHAFGLNFIAWVVSVLVTPIRRYWSCIIQPATGLIMATFEPTFPAVIPTPDSVFRGFLHTAASYLLGVPSFIEVPLLKITLFTTDHRCCVQEWSNDASKVEFMKHSKGVVSHPSISLPILECLYAYMRVVLRRKCVE